jgi:hypothetical protein
MTHLDICIKEKMTKVKSKKKRKEEERKDSQ